MRLSSFSQKGRSNFPSWTSFLLIHTLLLTLCLADPKLQDVSCTSTEFRCDCGVPKCVDKSLVKNGVKDCEDGSDEGEWDPSKCAIKNRTSEDIRFKRAAIPEFGDTATTTFFSHDRARTRPVGLLSTSVGAFVTSGTTTEYLTKVLGTYIKGTYARIISTSSKVYHALPTQGGEERPTGFIASTLSTEINGYATTLHTTDFYRTYIDGTYAQLVSSSSSVAFPNWYTDKIEPTSVQENIYPTATPLPKEIRGNFINNVVQSKAYAEIGIKAIRPNNKEENELQVTGTHGKFVHSDSAKGDETTYNVFTGSYIQNMKTYLFFFGNMAIDPTKQVGGLMSTLNVESGNDSGVKVKMSNKLKVVVPSRNSRVKVDGSVGGVQMEGVLVEIEGSEDISVDGAEEMGTPSIDMITMTLDRKKNTRVSSSSSSSSSRKNEEEEEENEIPRARKVPDADQEIAPSRTVKRTLPTFTVGQPDAVELEEDEIIVTTPRGGAVETSTKSRNNGGSPVFHKKVTTTSPRTTDRIRALGYTQQSKKGSSSSFSNLNGKYPMPNRNHRAFAGFDAMVNSMNDVDNDLQSAATTGRATVTYVGFADFSTTVGNTVIIFMPRTKMIEDLSVHATKTVEPSSAQVEPTRFVYHTNDESTTTEANDDDDDEEHVQFSVSQVQGRKVGKVGSSVKVQLKEDEEETTTEVNPSESVSSISGRETVFIGGSSSAQKPKVRPSSGGSSSSSERRNSLFSSPRVKFTPGSKLSPSSPVFNRKSATSVYQTASTKVFQTDVLNPTGLVTSIDGTFVKEGKTTLYTSLVYGTFIGKSYAQVIKSSSQVVKESIVPVATSSLIKPTSVARLPVYTKKTSSTPVYYEFSTTTQSSSDDDEDETTTLANKDLDRMEVSVSSTTERASKEDDIVQQTTLDPSYDEDDLVTTTTEKDVDVENEIRRRKVEGKAKDQIIVDLEPSVVGGEDEEQTIYVTRTLKTTIFKTLTFYTTFFIPDEGTTSTRIVSREVTSTTAGLVRKTLTSIIPRASGGVEVKPSEEAKPGKRFRGKDPGAQVIYKTLYTTYTYLTSFFSGSTSSVSSREETVSNVITITSGLGSTSTQQTSEQIVPTSTPSKSLRSRGYKTVTSRFSSAPQGGSSNVGVSSPSPSSSRSGSRSSIIRRPKLKASISPESDVDSKATDEIEYQSVTKTLLRTFMTTYTYFTTLFQNGDDTSIKSRTEVITNVVPYVTKTLTPIIPSASPTTSATENEADNDEYEDMSSSVAFKMSNNNKSKAKETTFYTTYTYLSTIFLGKSSTVKTSKQTYTNIVVEDKTLRSGYIEAIEPTKLSGRSAGNKATQSLSVNDIESQERDEELENVTTFKPHTEYELEGSEDVGVTTNVPENYEDDENDVPTNEKTPILKTLFTTFTFYTTRYYNGGSTISSRLETKSQIVTDSNGLLDETEDVTVTDKAALLSTIDPTYPITYFTTYTYWTTSFKDGSSIVTSREETITNVVTPGVNDIAPSSSISANTKKSENNEILPSSSQEVELTTFYTTYTYFTTSYLAENTVINSRLETVTNVITGTPIPSPSSTQTGRAIGTVKPDEQKITGQDKDEYEDYATGLLSTIASSEVRDGTTTIFSTDVFGTLIDGIYAQVLESTSKVIHPTAAAFTRFFPEASETVTGVVSVNEGQTIESDKGRTTFYATTAYGTIIDGQYAHLVESTSSVKSDSSRTLEPSLSDSEIQKTGLVRVIDGTLVEGEKTTFYTSSILGTFIDGQYAQVIESTSRFSVNPTKSVKSGSSKSVFVDVESSVTESSSSDEEGVTTTTEKEVEKSTEKPRKNGIVTPKRFGANKDRSNSRLSFTTTSKTFSPAITPFASRSRPSGFVPRRRTSSIAISATKSEDASTTAPTSTSSRGGFQSKRRFQKPTEVAGDGTTTPTPALPASRVRGNGRFSKPPVGVKSRFEKTSAPVISASSASGSPSGGSSPGARGRSSFSPRGSSVAGGGRSRSSSSSATAVKGSSTAGFRGGSSSRFSPGGRSRSTSAINPSATQATAITPTQSSSSLSPEEYEEGEYEYENGGSSSSSSTSSTTEAPKNPRFGGGGSNRFRLNQKLSTPSGSSSQTTTSRPITTRGSPLNLRRFSKPTIPTRGTTAASSTTENNSGTDSSSSSQASANSGDEYYEYEEVPSSSTTTVKPRPGFGSKKPIQPRPTSARPQTTRTNNRLTTTNAPEVVQTTPRRIYTPRARPAGFPKALSPLSKTTSTTASPSSADEYYEDTEFEYQESKNLPSNATLLVDQAGAGSELSEVIVQAPPPAPQSLGEYLEENSDFLASIFKDTEGEDESSSSSRRRRRRRRSALNRIRL